MPLIIGVDFDNTIVSYDGLMRSIAIDWGVPIGDAGKSKKQIRDIIRGLSDGEILWQRLQTAAYGIRMDEAKPTAGVEEFFLICKELAIPIRIVSHKTKYPNLGEQKVDLRAAAMAWLVKQGFVSEDGFGIARTDVYFESSRAEKIARIRQLEVTHFIDDLEETFSDPGFPANVRKMLYSSDAPTGTEKISTFASWMEIRDFFLSTKGRTRYIRQA